MRDIGEVAKRSNAADCKSVALAASEVRILPSPSDRPIGRSAHRSIASTDRLIASADRQIDRPIGSTDRDRPIDRCDQPMRRCDGPMRRSTDEPMKRGSNSVVESQPSKLLVAGSIPVSRSKVIRGALPLGLPYGVAREPLRRLAPLRRGASSLAPFAGAMQRGVVRRVGAVWRVLKGGLSVPRTRERALASEPRERSEPAKRRARERVGESEGRSPSDKNADVAQLAERVLGKDEVTSSILVIGSTLRSLRELRVASQASEYRRRVPTVARSAKVGGSTGLRKFEERTASCRADAESADCAAG